MILHVNVVEIANAIKKMNNEQKDNWPEYNGNKINPETGEIDLKYDVKLVTQDFFIASYPDEPEITLNKKEQND